MVRVKPTRALSILILALLLSVAACRAQDGAGMGGRAAAAARTPATVTRVVDGDTLIVRLADGRRPRVRLIGIDTPESVRPDTPVACGGPQATRGDAPAGAARRRAVTRAAAT